MTPADLHRTELPAVNIAAGIANPCSEIPLSSAVIIHPILDMEEAYKAYLEDVLAEDRRNRTYYHKNKAHKYSSRGQTAQRKLDELRNTHPELFI